jgi:hypothetical protein
MMTQDWSAPDLIFASDACLEGCGGTCGKEFFHSRFPQFIKNQELHINALELLAIIVCFKLWGSTWKGKQIAILCDNMTSVIVINNGATRDPFLQSCLREIAFLSAIGEFVVMASHIPGVENRHPDLLSRWDISPVAKNQFQDIIKEEGLTERAPSPELFRFCNNW